MQKLAKLNQLIITSSKSVNWSKFVDQEQHLSNSVEHQKRCAEIQHHSRVDQLIVVIVKNVVARKYNSLTFSKLL